MVMVFVRSFVLFVWFLTRDSSYKLVVPMLYGCYIVTHLGLHHIFTLPGCHLFARRPFLCQDDSFLLIVYFASTKSCISLVQFHIKKKSVKSTAKIVLSNSIQG